MSLSNRPKPRRRINWGNLALVVLICGLVFTSCAALGALVTKGAVTILQR